MYPWVYYILGGIFAALSALCFTHATNLQSRQGEQVKPAQFSQTAQGNNNTQSATLGSNSPVINNLYMNFTGSAFEQNPDIILELKRQSMWSPSSCGDRRSYSRLLLWKNSPKDSVTKDLLMTAIEEIENQYATDIMRLNTDPVPSIFGQFICKESKPSCTKGFEPPVGFYAPNIINHLDRKWWQERSRAASLLRNLNTASGKENIDKERLFEKLVERFDPQKENCLYVGKMALETYMDLTGFSSEKSFDFEGATKDWEKRKVEILKRDF